MGCVEHGPRGLGMSDGLMVERVDCSGSTSLVQKRDALFVEDVKMRWVVV